MDRIDDIIKNYKSIAITGHVHPDGDCTGSTLGLYNYIRTYYPDIRVNIFLEDIPDVFKFLKNSSEIQNPQNFEGEDFELFISLDSSDRHRLGDALPIFERAKETICIDHHVSNQGFAGTNHIDADASSTCEVVCELLDMDKINKDIAECLYMGIVHDTGVFQFSCTGSRTLEIAAMLINTGVNFSEIIEKTFFEKTFIQNKLLALALSKAELYFDGRIIATIISKKDFKSLGASKKDTEGIVTQLRYTKGTDVAVFMYENIDGTHKVSLRSNGRVNVADIAVKHSGGGHERASGFTVGNLAQKELNKIIEEIKAFYE